MSERAAVAPRKKYRGLPRAGSVLLAAPASPLAGAPSRSGVERSSGGVGRDAATAVAASHFGLRRQPTLTLLAPRIAQHHVMRPAGAGRFLFGVTRTPIPHALSECRHERP